MSHRRVVAITGASSGIGRVSAQLFARRGWDIGLIARNADALGEAQAECERYGSRAVVAAADVTDRDALEEAAETIEGTLGPIDVWVNDAGQTFYGKFWETPADEFAHITAVTYLGAVNGTRVALSRMRARNAGTIVNVISAVSYRAIPLQSAYSGAKYALRGFTEAVRSELINDWSRVHLTMVHPPATNTPFFSHAGSVMDGAPRPPPPVYQPELVAEGIYLAATSRRREVRVGGSTEQFAIGNRLFPGLLDWVSGLLGVAAQRTRRRDVAALRDPNLHAPGELAYTTHGPYDRESTESSLQFWLTRNRLPLALGAVALLAVRPRRRAPARR